ncbi:hypothetical protein L596_015717 [Steinernema carpocapsae]|uniref:Uncharacterized protein n=1 Tax=Steinernema carpocapsae TaxID=34508 RepID=A0A4U5NGS7_STECR|nr:hypothetical protein L596_015717 [Steinernema carpocapsae]
MQLFSFVASLFVVLFALLPNFSALPMIASPNSKAHNYISSYDFEPNSDEAAFLAAFQQFRPMQKKWNRLEPSIRFF